MSRPLPGVLLACAAGGQEVSSGALGFPPNWALSWVEGRTLGRPSAWRLDGRWSQWGLRNERAQMRPSALCMGGVDGWGWIRLRMALGVDCGGNAWTWSMARYGLVGQPACRCKLSHDVIAGWLDRGLPRLGIWMPVVGAFTGGGCLGLRSLPAVLSAIMSGVMTTKNRARIRSRFHWMSTGEPAITHYTATGRATVTRILGPAPAVHPLLALHRHKRRKALLARVRAGGHSELRDMITSGEFDQDDTA